MVLYGFNYKGKIINVDLLFEMLSKRNEAEMTPLFKLADSHLIMTPQQRQNVRSAAELLSRTTSVALRRYYPENEDARRLADLIEKIDLWFSVSNTYTPTAKLDYKKSYTGSDDQLNALMDMFEFTFNMVPCGKNKIQVFQKSILMQINSLQMLFDEMKSKYGQKVKFISTHKVKLPLLNFLMVKLICTFFLLQLNQDVLENFFSQLRQKGGVYDHPSPLSCIYRIRFMILGKSPTILRNQTDVGPSNPQPQDEYISSQPEPADHECNYIQDQNEPIISSRILTQADITPNLPNIEDVQKENGITTQDNSDTFSTVSSSDLKLPEQDGDGLQYIMGYIAKSYHKKFRELKLGEFTFKMTTDHSYSNPPSFVQLLSVGGLFAPSESFLKQGNKMEKIFLKFNREGSICKKKGIFTRLTKTIKRRIPESPEEIIKKFVKQRVIVRMRYKNMLIMNEKNIKKKRKIADNPKAAKKMKKITN